MIYVNIYAKNYETTKGKKGEIEGKSFGDHIQVSTGLLNQALMLFFMLLHFMSFEYFSFFLVAFLF